MKTLAIAALLALAASAGALSMPQRAAVADTDADGSGRGETFTLAGAASPQIVTMRPRCRRGTPTGAGVRDELNRHGVTW